LAAQREESLLLRALFLSEEYVMFPTTSVSLSLLSLSLLDFLFAAFPWFFVVLYHASEAHSLLSVHTRGNEAKTPEKKRKKKEREK